MKKISILLATFLAFTLTSCNNNSPEKVVSDFYQATQDYDIEKALTYTNLNEADRQQVSELIDQMGMVIHEYKVLGSTIDEGDTTATVTLHLVASNAFNPDTLGNDLEIPCQKVDGQWKVKFM